MGLVVACWDFDKNALPSPEIVAARLSNSMALEVSVAGQFENPILAVAQINYVISDWTEDAQRLKLCGTTPAHPYVWTHMNKLMMELGGIQSKDGIWEDIPILEHLEKSWPELSRFQRFILKVPPLFLWRPFDFLL